MDRIPGFCFCGRKSENLRDKDDPRCSTCKKAERVYEAKELVAKEKAEMRRVDIRLKGGVQGKPIKKVSGKMASLLNVYETKRRKFLRDNPKCAVYPNKKSTTIHHRAGRVGFHDEWARVNGVPRLIDERWFLAVSMEGHVKIEREVDWAKENGFSLNRI